MSPEGTLRNLAAARHGVFSREEALALGLSTSAIDRRIASGQWLIVHPGVYRIVGTTETWESRLVAALLYLGGEATASHRSAGAIWELDGVPHGWIELTSPVGTPVPPTMTVHRIRGPLPSRREIGGLRVTSVERTLFDLCAVLPPKACGRALDDALRRRITTLQRLWDMASSSKGRTGARVFRQLIALRDDRDGHVASRMETLLLRILKRIEEQRAEAQWKVVVGDHSYRVDFAYPALMVGIEAHSMRYHGPEAFNSDVRRDRHLRLAGWFILYFCWDDIWFDPEGVERDVREALKQRSIVTNPGFRA